MRRQWLGACIVIVLGAMTATAASADQEYDDCLAQARSRMDIGYCGQAHVDREEAKMGAKWKEIAPLLSPDSLSVLEADQATWRQYQENACTFYRAAPFPQEDQTALYNDCRISIVSRRLAELSEIYRLLLVFR